MFKNYNFKCWKKEIRFLLRRRLHILDRIRYHKNKIIHHEDKIKILKDITLIEVEKELNSYLKKAGNN